MDDQQVELATEHLSQVNNNVEQLEFLQFLNNLDGGVPHELVGGHDDDNDAFSELHNQHHHHLSQDNNHQHEAEAFQLTIPHITISMPEGQFLDGQSEPGIPQINISFSNLPPAPPDRVKTQLQLQLEQLTLQKHHFVHKLFLAASSQRVTFINWSSSGQALQLDYIGLQEHLSGEHSMFRSRSVRQFAQHILDIGFERVTLSQQELEAELQAELQLEFETELETMSGVETRPQLLFQHSCFQPNQPELLLHLPTPEWELSQAEVKSTSLSSSSSQTPLQLARGRFDILLQYHNDVRLLQLQEPSAEQLVPRRGRISSSRQPVHLLTPSLATKHVNPRDSVLQFELGQVPEYAGFYGRAEPALISEFFAEYLPRYGARISGYKDIVVDASKANSFQQNLPIGIASSEDEEELDQEHQQHQQQQQQQQNPAAAVEAKNDDAQSLDTANSLPEDIELEQVMQELCGVVPGAEEEEAEEQPKPKPKLKRKKLVRKCAELESQSANQEEAGEQLLEVPTNVKDELEKTNSSKDIGQAETKRQTTPKKDVKRRRYDLRNSKAKRSN